MRPNLLKERERREKQRARREKRQNRQRGKSQRQIAAVLAGAESVSAVVHTIVGVRRFVDLHTVAAASVLRPD